MKKKKKKKKKLRKLLNSKLEKNICHFIFCSYQIECNLNLLIPTKTYNVMQFVWTINILQAT